MKRVAGVSDSLCLFEDGPVLAYPSAVVARPAGLLCWLWVSSVGTLWTPWCSGRRGAIELSVSAGGETSGYLHFPFFVSFGRTQVQHDTEHDM